MRAVVTVLRAPTGAPAAAAAATVDYVAGSRQALLPDVGVTGSSDPAGNRDVGGYYADQTPHGAGRWLGAGASRFGLGDRVARDDLEALLRGEDPRSGEALIPTQGSNQRALERHTQERGTQRPESRDEPRWDQSAYTFREAAALLGVSDRYLRKVAGHTRALLTRTGGDGSTLGTLLGSRAYLLADQGDDGMWRVQHDELVRFAASRRAASVIIGFDVTFSVPKSVSVLWAGADEPTRAAITAAFDHAVDAGVAYLERHAAVTGRGAQRTPGRGLTAGSFTHVTSRDLDPQLHAHVVVANAVERPDGTYRAVDGSSLFEHAKTAAYLAGAELRAELRSRLGIGWRPVRSGIVEVEGVPRAVIEAMSARRVEIDRVADALDVTSATGRRALALRTRAPKRVESLTVLEREWATRLAEVGFGPAEHAACLDQARNTRAPTRAEIDAEFTRLVRHDGLTAHSPTFTRQDVVQSLVDWSVDRLDAAGVERLANVFLADERVLTLHSHSNPSRLTQPGGQSLPPSEPRYTTRTVVRAEGRILDAFRRGVRALPDALGPSAGDAINDPARHLSTEQRDGFDRLTRSPHRVQCVVGPAGSGKTTILRAAAAAWQSAGHTTVGVAVQGTAAENLEHATGIPSQTLAAFLTRAEHNDPSLPVDPQTIVVVDEASTVGTFDLARLLALVEAAGARVVLVGDPAQHGAVSAGGGFAALTRRWRHLAVHVTGAHRQAAPEMRAVRAAVDDLRARETDAGLHRLLVDERVHEAPSRPEAYAAMVRAWLEDRARPGTGGVGRRVCMITEDHRTRRALIALARAQLQASGELVGPTFEAGGQSFQAGDEVIARAPARDLHPASAPERHVRNGTGGRVVAVHQPDLGREPAGMWVDFEHRGVLYVSRRSLTEEIRPGIVGVLTHSYALTSHAAQGATFDVARMFATEGTGPAALYVGTSRARDDLGVYTAPHTPFDTDDPSPGGARVAREGETGLQALARHARNRRDDCLAIDRDPTLLARFDPSAASPPPPEPAASVTDRPIGPAPDIAMPTL